MWTTQERCPHGPQAHQQQQKRSIDVLPKPDNLTCCLQHHEGWPSPELERWATLVKTALWQLAHTKPTSEFVLASLAEYTDKLEAELNSPPPGAPACWT